MSLLNVKARNTTVHEPDTLTAARAWLAAYLADLGASGRVLVAARTLEEGAQITFRKVPYWIERF